MVEYDQHPTAGIPRVFATIVSFDKLICFANYPDAHRNTFFAVHLWQKYRKTGLEFGNTGKNAVWRVGVYLLQGAGNSRRSVLSFADKCQLLRRGGE